MQTMVFFAFYCYVTGNIRELGIDTLKLCELEEIEMLKLAQTMFDTKLPPGVKMLQPFSEGSSIKKISVRVCMSSIKILLHVCC